MIPYDFIAKWRAAELKERAASQEHFLDLCRLVGHPTPAEADPTGASFCFERGAAKTGGGDGWADVWKRGFFGWEYKGKRHDLKAAFAQLQRYAIALENPPLLVVSDMDTIVIHTNWTNTVQEIHTIAIEDLERPEVFKKLCWLFFEPERFRPGVTREMVTERAARTFAGMAQRLRDAGHDGHQVAHFLNRLVFAMFAEDIGILPGQLFSRLVESVQQRPEKLADKLRQLFVAMQSGGDFGVDEVPWFNGGLYDSDDVLPLDGTSVSQLLACCRLDWSDIEPSIFGTLFERGLDPSKRSQLGAHYTDRDAIMRIVGPVVVEPLAREWDTVKAEIEKQHGKGTPAGHKRATKLFEGFLAHLRATRVLDPACGSGNFLNLSLLALKDLEHRVLLEGEMYGFHRDFPAIGPQNVLGIELNDYAAELARVSVWIADIQWAVRNGMGYTRNPILRPLDNIECRDAVLNDDGSEAHWPACSCIVGNPPFLGSQRILNELGEEYAGQLRRTYTGRIPGGADLVTYWHEKARTAIAEGAAKRAGLVSTNSIRGGANRKVLERIRESGRIFNAWGDEPWINEGAAVRVSLVCFDGGDSETNVLLDGQPAVEIYADLTAHREGTVELDLTTARTLTENRGVAYQGPVKVGPFDIPGQLARQWLLLPRNPNGRPNSDVVRPWSNGMDITRKPSDTWIVDFASMDEGSAALYEAPFEYVRQTVKPERDRNRDAGRKRNWWLHGRTGYDFRQTVEPLICYIATPRVAKHRLFVWLDKTVLPDSAVVAICRDDYTTFGILHSRFHELWALRMCTYLGVGNDPRYTPSTTFETFPFPGGLAPNVPAADYAADPRAQAITEAARRLVELRDAWLYPPELVRRVPEVVAGYSDRILPASDVAAVELKRRTLTNLYNARPAWLANAHADLDVAVATAYGWPTDLADDDILARLLALNHERSGL
jgi:type II restriction/modification system DNA methylase subunit YeeA